MQRDEVKKKLLQIQLFIVCLFTFNGCRNELEVDIEKSVVGIDITVLHEEYKDKFDYKNFWIIKYFVDPESFSVADANRIKIKTYIPKFDNYHETHTYGVTFNAIIPDDVEPTKDKNYFIVKLDYDKYYPVREYSYGVNEELNYVLDENGEKHYIPSSHLIILNCYAYVYEEPGAEVGANTIPSIFNTILLGLGMIVFSVFIFWIATCFIQNKISILIAFLIPLTLTLTSFGWGIGRGIIMSVCFVIYYILITLMVKRIDEYL